MVQSLSRLSVVRIAAGPPFIVNESTPPKRPPVNSVNVGTPASLETVGKLTVSTVEWSANNSAKRAAVAD